MNTRRRFLKESGSVGQEEEEERAGERMVAAAVFVLLY